MNPNNKPGWKTTEFWVTILSLVLTILTNSGIVKMDSSEASQMVSQIAPAAVTLVTAIVYITARTSLKSS